MAPPLSDNQERVLAFIRGTGPDGRGGCSGAKLETVRDRARNPLGDAARKVAGRLESRGLVRGEGSGAGRWWWLTPAGLELIDEIRPRSAGSKSNGTPSRPYVVLEQTTLAELLVRELGDAAAAAVLEGVGAHDEDLRTSEVYVIAAEVEARNTEHAYRQVAKGVYGVRASQHDLWDEDGEYVVPSVAIDGGRWKVELVKPKQDISVSIG